MSTETNGWYRLVGAIAAAYAITTAMISIERFANDAQAGQLNW